MSILAWIEDQKRLKLLNAPKHVNTTSDSSKGLWTRCDKCGVILYIKHLKENQRVCFGCSYHLQMSSQERVENLLDKDTWRPLDETVSPCDPLEFHDQKDYTDRLQEAQERTGLQDAIQTGSGMVEGIPVALGVMDFDFMGGSMGSVVGEKVTRLIEYATQEGLTLILVCASGGARMQEGVFSLMQMAKISSALQIYQSCANLLYISILTSPTTGGVTASFAMLGDIIFAEPKALIAFAGRRVIEQTLCEDLPEDFQTSEYMLHHGLLDLIVPRRFLRQALSESILLYKNAPFKKPGRIPFGVQNPTTFLIEEKIRRQISKTNMGLTGVTSTADFASIGKQHELPLISNNHLKRETGEYRDILTSFQTMFTLFSKNRVLPYSSDRNNTNDSQFYGQSTEKTNIQISNHNSNFPEQNYDNPLGNQPKPAKLVTETDSSGSAAYTADTDLEFLNKSIELAVTQSIEWRAFYVHQKISETTGFIEDFLNDSPLSAARSKAIKSITGSSVLFSEGSNTYHEKQNMDSTTSPLNSGWNSQTSEPSSDKAAQPGNQPSEAGWLVGETQNVLFYRSICKSFS